MTSYGVKGMISCNKVLRVVYLRQEWRQFLSCALGQHNSHWLVLLVLQEVQLVRIS